MIEVSGETATFLLHVLSGLTLSVGAPDFEATARAVIVARTELGRSAAETPNVTEVPNAGTV